MNTLSLSLGDLRRASTRKKEHVNSPLGLHQGQNAWWEPLAQVVEMGDSRGSRSAPVEWLAQKLGLVLP